MARRKRQYGSGCLLRRKGGWAIRWRETQIGPDGTKKRVLRFQTLGKMSRKQANDMLVQRVAAASTKTVTAPSTLTFRELAVQWQATVLPMYKHSTRTHRTFFTRKHLIPRFGDRPVSAMTRQEVQAYVTELVQAGYAPKSIDNIHDTLSAVLRTGVEWGHLQDNPARGVRLPKLKLVRPKWVLTTSQAGRLLEVLAPLPRTMAGLVMLTGLRRGELFALRWRDLDEESRLLTVREAVYDGVFDTPKTEASRRQIPLSDAACVLVARWRARTTRIDPEALVFSARAGKPVTPNNVLRRHLYPACTALGLPRATWLTFRRTYSSWSHDKGVPAKVVAQLMGHANIDTTLNVYTQVLEGSLRAAVDKIGTELFTIVQSPPGGNSLTH